MGDYLVRAIAKKAGIRALVAQTTELTQEATRRHQTLPAATYLLSEALNGAVLFGALLKIQQRVALKFEGNGPAGKLLVESDAYGKVRGYISNPKVDAATAVTPAITAEALGRAGLLTVVKDLRLKDLAESLVPLGGTPLDTELTRFLIQSEQIPSLVSTGTKLDENGRIIKSGGLLLQAMPDHDPDVLSLLINRLEEMPPFEAMLVDGRSPEKILADLFGDIEYEQIETRRLQFHCGCSRERTESALIAMGRHELENILETQGEVTVDCHFCHESYLFTREDLEDLLVEMV